MCNALIMRWLQLSGSRKSAELIEKKGPVWTLLRALAGKNEGWRSAGSGDRGRMGGASGLLLRAMLGPAFGEDSAGGCRLFAEFAGEATAGSAGTAVRGGRETGRWANCEHKILYHGSQ